jgi:hypothetical protein
MPKENIINLLICLAILFFFILACDGGSRVRGFVYDSENKPIQNAIVKFESVRKGEPEESYQSIEQTDKNGRFDCRFTHSPFETQLKLTVSKVGYKTYEIRFSSSEAQKKLENKEEYRIVLEKE